MFSVKCYTAKQTRTFSDKKKQFSPPTWNAYHTHKTHAILTTCGILGDLRLLSPQITPGSTSGVVATPLVSCLEGGKGLVHSSRTSPPFRLVLRPLSAAVPTTVFYFSFRALDTMTYTVSSETLNPSIPYHTIPFRAPSIRHYLCPFSFSLLANTVLFKRIKCNLYVFFGTAKW